MLLDWHLPRFKHASQSSHRPHIVRTGDHAPRDTSDNGLPIKVRGLSKRYGAREVLRSVDFDAAPGEFIAVVGRSGCGKSTLLRLLAGLEQASPSTLVSTGNEPLKFGDAAFDTAQAATRIMFQDARLLPWRRILDNVKIGLPRAQWDAAEHVLRSVGLAERGRDWPYQLSGGQRQRVALARALIHRPKLLLLDEPLGALDALTRIEMQRLIEALWQRDRFTAVLVTHDVTEAVALADRILVIEDGAVVLNQRVDLPRPRTRGDAGAAAIEARILDQVLGSPRPSQASAAAG